MTKVRANGDKIAYKPAQVAKFSPDGNKTIPKTAGRMHDNSTDNKRSCLAVG